MLTDEVNKNVMKADIVKVLNMVKHEETQLFMMDNKDMGELHHGFGGGMKNGGDEESSDEEKEVRPEEGEKEEDEAGIFLPWRVKDLWSGTEGVGALPHHKTVVLLLSLY